MIPQRQPDTAYRIVRKIEKLHLVL